MCMQIVQMVFGPLVLSFVMPSTSQPRIGACLCVRVCVCVSVRGCVCLRVCVWLRVFVLSISVTHAPPTYVPTGSLLSMRGDLETPMQKLREVYSS